MYNNLNIKESPENGGVINKKHITKDFIKNLSEDEKIIFICKIDCDSVDELKIPNIIERHIIFNIAKNKEISLAVLLKKLIEIEKALNRKIDRDTILKICDKYVQKGQIIRLYLKSKEDFNSLNLSKIFLRGNI